MKHHLPWTMSLLFSGLALATNAPFEKTALSMVPKGILLENSTTEYTVKTPAGTKIKVEFEFDGKFQEASGLNLNHGDEFEPGHGLVSLGSAAKSLVQAGHKVIKGEWSLEKDHKRGWIYEIAIEVNEEKIFRLIMAQNGQLISDDK